MFPKGRLVALLSLVLTAGACGSELPNNRPPDWPSDVDAPATTSRTVDDETVRRSPSENHPLRVTTIGDSVAYDADLGIRASLESTGRVVVVNRSYGGVGLLRPQFESYLEETMQGAPEVVVAMLGGWDLGEALTAPEDYRLRIEQVFDRLLADGALVVWLGMPPTPPGEGLEEARAVLNRLYEETAENRPDVAFRSTDALLGDTISGFKRVLPGVDGRLAQVRKIRDGRDDGHLCPAGAALIGQLVYLTVGIYHPLPAQAPEWWLGEWTGNDRYEDPPGGCPGGDVTD